MKVLEDRRPPETPGETLVRDLFAEHAGAIFCQAIAITRDRGAAEDIVQETVLRAWRHSDVLRRDPGPLRGWLLTVARNLAIDRVRYRKGYSTVLQSTDAYAVEHDHADKVVNSVTVLDALDHLPKIHREVLVQVYLNDCSVGEAAEALGIPAGTVKSRSYYGIRTLRDLLDVCQVGA